MSSGGRADERQTMNEPKRLDGFLLNGVPDEQDLRDYA